jgi:two-component system, NarL family, response regulator NreC
MLPKLTPPEHEILALIINEYTNDEIAKELKISVQTVNEHSRNMFVKLGTDNAIGLLKQAVKYKIINL